MQTSFWGWVHNSAALACSNKEGEIQADLAPFSQTVTTVIIEDLLAGKAGYKKMTKSGFEEFALVEKFAQLLLMKCIQQSKNFLQKCDITKFC